MVVWFVPALIGLGIVAASAGGTAVAINNFNNESKENLISGLPDEQKPNAIETLYGSSDAPLFQYGDNPESTQNEIVSIVGDGNTTGQTQGTEQTGKGTDILSTLASFAVPAAVCLGGVYLITRKGAA